MDNPTLMAAAKGADRLFHCAALVSDWGTDQDFQQTNVNGTRRVLAAATRAEVSKFVFLSTSDIYGFPGQPVDETELPSPRGFPYSDSKVDAESLVWSHYRRVRLPITILRPATVYGPGSRLLVLALIRLLRRRALPLIDGGEHIAGLTYVGNLADALILAADNQDSVGQAYNISDGSKVTWREYVEALSALAGVPKPSRDYPHWRAFSMATFYEYYHRLIGRPERPPLTRMMVELMGTDQDFPIDKAERQLGYRPRVGFEQGIRFTGDWLRQQGLLD
jgi:nucleoside-diphosphate-sugar epimerase